MWIEVVLPLPLKKYFTYKVPDMLMPQNSLVGRRVEVPFGKRKIYSGIVVKEIADKPSFQSRDILSILDESPIIASWQIQLWEWIASYYMATTGEVFKAAMPSGMILHSESYILPGEHADEDDFYEDDADYLLMNVLHDRGQLSVSEASELLERMSISNYLNKLSERGLITFKEELKQTYKPKKRSFVRFVPHDDNDTFLLEALDKVKKSERQTRAVLGLHRLSKGDERIKQSAFISEFQLDYGVLKALTKKGIIDVYEEVVSRLNLAEVPLDEPVPLTEIQQEKLDEIRSTFDEKNAVLLHGVTGSGKTNIYIELIRTALERGGQVLYLLPEIALTTQIVRRVKSQFGNKVLVYHSKLSNAQRVEIFERVQQSDALVIGVRSALFLPWRNLDYIIVDESHDPSYKQKDPAPRYNARDTAIYLGSLLKAKVLLGTATPSIETAYNATKGKYGLVKLYQRYKNLSLPETHIVDLKAQGFYKPSVLELSKELEEAIDQSLADGKQIILFQNRRGFAPILQCHTCSWHAKCVRCDISLTYHKYKQHLSCHYCSYTQRVYSTCPQCGGHDLGMKGFGTEMIEEELKLRFPQANIARLDLDTARTPKKLDQIITDFELRDIDILVGTQMITKGLDFDHVNVVGVLNADKLLSFPDFRAGERGFQLLMQVSGRAGRKEANGSVYIQSFNPRNNIYRDVSNADYWSFYDREIEERRQFGYPPFIRMISLQVLHKKEDVLHTATQELYRRLVRHFGAEVLKPYQPSVKYLRNRYQLMMIIKMPRSSGMAQKKAFLDETIGKLKTEKGWSGLIVKVDVDPYL